MKILVKAKTGSKENKVIEKQANLWSDKNTMREFVVYVKERPIKGMANREIVETLSKYFKVPLSCVLLVSGVSAKNKVFDILI